MTTQTVRRSSLASLIAVAAVVLAIVTSGGGGDEAPSAVDLKNGGHSLRLRVMGSKLKTPYDQMRIDYHIGVSPPVREEHPAIVKDWPNDAGIWMWERSFVGYDDLDVATLQVNLGYWPKMSIMCTIEVDGEPVDRGYGKRYLSCSSLLARDTKFDPGKLLPE